jgi:hypothetical protein
MQKGIVSESLVQLLRTKLNHMNLYRDDVASFFKEFPIATLANQCIDSLMSDDYLDAAMYGALVSVHGIANLEYEACDWEWKCRVLCVLVAKKTALRFPYFVLQLLTVFDHLDNKYDDKDMITQLQSSGLRCRLLQTAAYLLSSMLLPYKDTSAVEVSEASVVFALTTKHCLPAANLILIERSRDSLQEAVCQRIGTYTADEGIGLPVYVDNLNAQSLRNMRNWINSSFAIRFLPDDEVRRYVKESKLKYLDSEEDQCAYIALNGEVKVKMVKDVKDIFDFKFKFSTRGNLLDAEALDKLKRKGVDVYLPDDIVDDDPEDEDAVNVSKEKQRQHAAKKKSVGWYS